ncbi:MAG: binding-protein-dependent transport system inner rane component [Firmicutes bacterium]|nr:binding-protein-dependent transport system inner rane component [Bacillota bacterium]
MKLSDKYLLRRIWRYRALYIFILPAVIWYIIFCYIPMYGLALGFKEFHFNMSIWESPWVGMRYFKQFINDRMFWPLLQNTVIISVLKMVIGFPAPIILALMINEVSNKYFKKTIQTVTYLPYFVSWVVCIAVLVKFISPHDGIINSILVNVFHKEAIYFMGEKNWFYPLVLFTDIWKNVGWNSIVYLSALAGIDQQLYEAASIDGAGKWKRMLHITLPNIMPTACILFLLNIGNLLKAGYEQIILLKTPGNSGLSMILDTQIIQQGIQQGRYEYATVAGLFQSVIGLILVIIVNRITKKLADVSLW